MKHRKVTAGQLALKCRSLARKLSDHARWVLSDPSGAISDLAWEIRGWLVALEFLDDRIQHWFESWSYHYRTARRTHAGRNAVWDDYGTSPALALWSQP